jgi:hypothetical protein
VHFPPVGVHLTVNPKPTSLAELLGAPTGVTKQCAECKEEKLHAHAFWPTVKMRPVGSVCRACHGARVKKSQQAARDRMRAEAEAKAVAAVSPEGVKLAKVEAKLEITRGLRIGADALNAMAESAWTRLAEWAEDPEHPSHQWAIEQIISRTAPRKLYEEIGAKAAGIDGPSDKRPVFNINILPATPGAGQGAVIDVQAVEVVDDGANDNEQRLRISADK